MPDQLHEQHFAELTRLIEGHTGIRLPSVKRTMVEGRLRKRVRALGLKDLSEYGAAIFNDGRLSEEFAHVVDCVTTNKTDFFREPQHFAFLRDAVVPSLLKLRRPAGAPLKFWSAASSIGAEAYTIAFVLADLLGADGPPFAILGTDISRDVLEQARRAVYPLALAEPIPEAVRRRYLMFARDAGRAEFRIVPELRRRVRFEALNLMDERFAVDRDFDVIFCRNVLIYFSKPTQAAVLRRLAAHLRPGGYLLLGHSESLAGNDHAELRPVAPTVFRRAF
jgi:chemotaxis protein methyltransferase CheR